MAYRRALFLNKIKHIIKSNKWDLPLTLLLVALGYICIHDIAGGTLFGHDIYDSYSLQAAAWLKGRFMLDQNYSWLELAVYNGNYYVSFPPVPTLFILPFVLLFGADKTPNNLIVALYAMAAVSGVYSCFRTSGVSSKYSCFWAVFAVLATNMAEISTNGGVWLQAQTLNMALCVFGIYCMLKNKRILSVFLFALAVGCRPFSIVLIPVALVYFFYNDRKAHPEQSAYSQLVKLYYPVFTAILVGLAYMWYNYLRFGNLFEFGHNYLPEFAGSEKGQFDLSYIFKNFYNICFRFISFHPDGKLNYPKFDGFVFYLINPIFTVFFIYIIKDLKNKRLGWVKAAICAGFLVNLILLCAHKTFGGYQFGARYTLDLIPYSLIYLLLSNPGKPKRWELALCAFGLLFNAYGAFTMRLMGLLK